MLKSIAEGVYHYV